MSLFAEANTIAAKITTKSTFQKELFWHNSFGQKYKTISLQSKFLRIFSCKHGTSQWQQHYKEIVLVELFFCNKIVPRNYFVILSARMVFLTSGFSHSCTNSKQVFFVHLVFFFVPCPFLLLFLLGKNKAPPPNKKNKQNKKMNHKEQNNIQKRKASIVLL